MPMPPLALPVDEDLQVDTSRVSLGGLHPIQLGNAPKYGAFIGTSFSRELGSIARGLHKAIAGSEAKYLELQGKTDYRASWASERGLLLGLTSEVR